MFMKKVLHTSHHYFRKGFKTRVDYSHGVLSSMCSPFLPQLRKHLGPFLVDKTKLIENVVEHGLNGNVDLVLRPRRCGKTTMLQMLRSFFSIPQDDDPDPRQLFHGLHIASRRDICEEHMGKQPTYVKQNLHGDSWENMFFAFKYMVLSLYKKWSPYLADSLKPKDKAFFKSICLNTASPADWEISLERLSFFLAQKSGRRVMVLIDEYEAPNIWAFEHGFFAESNEFFGHGVLPALLKTNKELEYAVLAGITPLVKAGWYSGLNNINIHPLHKQNSIFAGMVMFTESEVLQLGTLSNSILKLEDLKAHYNSYLAAGHISVYNPVSIMSAFEQAMIKDFWVATGQFPLLDSNFLQSSPTLDITESLLLGEQISFPLKGDVIFGNSKLDTDDTLTLLYYAGYLTMTPTGQFRIPNREVTMDWARWITKEIYYAKEILDTFMEGPVSTFEEHWPIFMQQDLHPKMVTKTQGTISQKTPEATYHAYIIGLMHILQVKGWEVFTERQAGGGYIDICLISKKKCSAVLIKLKSSKKEEDIKIDATNALKQIIAKNYENLEGLQDINFL